MTEPQASHRPLELAFSLVAEVEAPEAIDADDLAKLTEHVLRGEGAAGNWDVTVALVDDLRLQALHRDFMGLDSPTDIMTFPADEPDGTTRGGELVISVDRARAQAAELGLSETEEIRFLVAHGLLHLMGWRDDSDEERERMLERQRELLEGWERTGGAART